MNKMNRGLCFYLTSAIILVLSLTSHADIVINVGPGSFYTPSSTILGLGEKVTFNFLGGLHNAHSTNVPCWAGELNSGSPSSTPRTFTYTPTVIGAYLFQCDVHFFTGSFTVTGIPPTITTGSVNTLSVCGSGTIQFPYTTQGNFTCGGSFLAQLSDKNGSFSSPIVPVQTSSNNIFTITVPSAITTGSGYRVRVVYNNVIGNDNGQNISLTTAINPVVMIGSNIGGSICPGTDVTFSAITTGVSGSVGYIWKLNNTVVGNNTAMFETNSLNNQDVVAVTVTVPSGLCVLNTSAISNSYITTITSTITPTISISGIYDYPNYCQPNNLTITSSITGGGLAPRFVWTITRDGQNPIVVFGGSTTILSNFIGTVTGNLISSLACASPGTVTSNIAIFLPQPKILAAQPMVSITSTGTTISLISPIIPTTFSWYINESLITITSVSFTTTVSGIYKVKFKGTDGCPATTDGYNFQYKPTSVSDKLSEKEFNIYPNPATDKIIVSTTGGIKKSDLIIKIYDNMGRLVKESAFIESICQGGKGKECLCPGSSEVDILNLNSGYYILNIIQGRKVLFSGKFEKE